MSYDSRIKELMSRGMTRQQAEDNQKYAISQGADLNGDGMVTDSEWSNRGSNTPSPSTSTSSTSRDRAQWEDLSRAQKENFGFDKKSFKAAKKLTVEQGGDPSKVLQIERVHQGLRPDGKTEEGYSPSEVAPVPEIEPDTFYHGNRRPDYGTITEAYEDWYTDNVGTAIKEALTRIEVDPSEYGRTGTGYGWSKAQKYDADSERLMTALKKPVTDYLSNMDSKFGHGFGMWQADKKEFELPPKETRIQNPYRSDVKLAAQQAGVQTRSTTKVVSDIKDKVSIETPDTSQYRDSGLSILGRSRIGGESDLRIKSVDEL